MPRRFGIKTDRNADKVNGKIFPFIVTGKLFCKDILYVGLVMWGTLQLKELLFNVSFKRHHVF